MKKLSEYSIKNQQLILQQCPQASLLAGRKEWQELGFTIAPDAKPITIWAPVENSGKKAISWVQVLVYDVSQIQKNEK